MRGSSSTTRILPWFIVSPCLGCHLGDGSNGEFEGARCGTRPLGTHIEHRAYYCLASRFLSRDRHFLRIHGQHSHASKVRCALDNVHLYDDDARRGRLRSRVQGLSGGVRSI